MGQPGVQRNEVVVSYMLLRKIVGWIGSLLPVVLIVGGLVFVGRSLPDSMSAYYYTHMRNVFVGALCAVGIFLVGYDGHDDIDRWITNVAGFGAIGVAFLPATPPLAHLTVSQRVVGGFHVFFAAVTFIALGVMALRFAKSEMTPDGQGPMGRLRHELGLARPTGDRPLAPKRKRNVVYRICGVTILGCVVLAALSNVLPGSGGTGWPVVFAFEALAVFAFGVSWFVKGQALLPRMLRDEAPAAPEPTSQPAASALV